MRLKKPKRLLPGDTIGIIAPSRHIYDREVKVDRGKILEKLGYKIRLGKNFAKKFYNSAGRATERAEDLNNMFADREVKAIFCAIGGDSANQILDLIDYELIKKNPKIIIGYSDMTHLILAIFKKSSLITFHGPNINTLSRLTKKSLTQCLNLLAGEEKDYPSKFRIIKPGRAEGIMLGGNLFVINSMLKTEYCPDFKGSILFLEDIDEGLSSIEYQLYLLKLSGILKDISGIVIGHIERKDKNTRPLNEILLEITKDFNFPIIKVDYFGHEIKNFLTFPIGIKAKIDTKNKIFVLAERVVL